MDDRRFDVVAKVLGDGSRRAALKVLAASAVVSLRPGVESVDAKKKKKKKKVKCPTCPTPQSTCPSGSPQSCSATGGCCRASETCCSASSPVSCCPGANATCCPAGRPSICCSSNQPFCCPGGTAEVCCSLPNCCPPNSEFDCCGGNFPVCCPRNCCAQGETCCNGDGDCPVGTVCGTAPLPLGNIGCCVAPGREIQSESSGPRGGSGGPSSSVDGADSERKRKRE
jgi:hypothetical protein